MVLALKAGASAGSQAMRERVEGCAERVLGSLARRVRHAAIPLREKERPARRRLHACTLRLRVPGASDILVVSRRPDPDAAVAGAFRRARRELMRRRTRRPAPARGPQRMPASA